MNRRFAIGWTGTGWVGPELHASIKVNLTHEINSLIPLVQEEIKHGIESSIGQLEQWTPLILPMKLGPVINQVTGRVLVGQPLSRDPNWVGTTMQHVMSVMKFSDRLRTFPTIFRPIIGWLLPELGMVRQTKKSISAMLKTAMTNQLQVYPSNTPAPKESATTSDTSSPESMRLASWLSEKYAANRSLEQSADQIVRDYSTLFMAATGFPVLAITHILIDLAAYPEYLAPLRAEIDGQLKISTNGILDAKGVAKLTLLDSFCKESSRMNPPGIGKSFSKFATQCRPDVLNYPPNLGLR
jgi:cytochrome P450